VTEEPKDAKRRKAGKKSPGRRTAREKAAVLLYAKLHRSDAAAAKHFGVDERTVRRYRNENRSGKDPELSAAVLDAEAEIANRHLDELDEAFEALLQRIIKLAPRAKIGEATQALQVVGDLKQSRDVWAEDEDESAGARPAAQGAARPNPGGSSRATGTSGAAQPPGVH
jgi:transposase